LVSQGERPPGTSLGDLLAELTIERVDYEEGPMSISFSCSRCGKNLKAPENAAGKTSKCPGCGATVTCPGPGHDAELPGPPDGVDPYGDLDSDKPSTMDLAGASASASASAAARRPCPKCGEMIDDAAAKCRFCGAGLDPTIKKSKKVGGPKGGKAKLAAIASAQRKLIVCIFLQIVFYIGLVVTGGGKTPNTGPAMVTRVLGAATLVAGIVGTIYAFKLAIKLYSVGLGTVLGVLTLIPCLGLLVLLSINSKATTLLRDKGHHVGFMGADMSEF